MDVFDLTAYRALLRDQDGVISRRQLGEVGAAPHDVRRLVRRRELTVVYEGIYLNHTGAPTWQQRAWAAVLFAWPAALSGQSALRAEYGPGWRGCRDSDPIEIAIPSRRKVVAPAGVRVVRVAHFDARAQLDLHPPRMRFEEAALDAAASASNDLETIECLAAVVRSRCTTAARLQGALARRTRMPRRDWLAALLRDIAEGTGSVLEHGYLQLERAHGLPSGFRQVADRDSRGSLYRDVVYNPYDTNVELDGRFDHDEFNRKDADLDRDLDAARTGRTTLRLGWGQVYGRGCATIGKVAAVLAARGWSGRPRPCGPGCPVSAAFAA